MKHIITSKFTGLVLLAVLLCTACTEDWNEMNINPNQPSEVPASNVLGAGMTVVAGQLFGERIGIYYAGTWSGQLAAIGAGDYEFRVDINNGQWDNLYRAMAYFVDAGNIAREEGNQNLEAVSLIMKAYTAHQVTDMWGDIPYTQAFLLDKEGILSPEFDSQEVVYDKILSELAAANTMLDPNGMALGVGDFIYGGDIMKWKKFANSIRLRVAMRMSSVAPQDAAAVIGEILGNPATYPVFENHTDNAYLNWPGVSSNIEPWRQRLGTPTNKNDQYRTNFDLINLLENLDDPRLPVYADRNQNGVFNGYKMGIGQTSDPMNSNANVSHIGDRFGYDDMGFSPFMNASQVWFIKAEAYERGLVSGGSSQEAYEKGIEVSLEENGVAPEMINAYLQNSGVAWDSGSSTNLEKIRLQNWIALYKQSVEAWAEVRRTDVPLLDKVSNDYASSHNRPPFRMSYPANEIAHNQSFPSDINEVDIFYGIQLWWDTRTGVE
ncbi:SusD/RagB family nutrient-binding outer membrane lipoprotein [Cyclobacterium plantarum]|uniref:SusD/RagB family nutrient-binding outer membrane lipoprotein n=1 Tax=Cyclobacterium plantarum TaxID=2716263 RepID=A0ABX0HB92_9BACT|nr:SusD/RagB family nutrient-binding outer membrane lipoprotein [Cyclobacterium plantarum]NHE58178.1 SusD/RagB family nutrient-binding outer membrane lipoprotein [Cyclobacterium plantarum]